MFRILSLDGGGILGTFTASVLATIEEETRLSIADHFDLITGTSTGGILAIGMGLGIPPRELVDFYLKRGAQIFPATGRLDRTRFFIRQFFRPKLAQAPLAAALNDVIGDRTLGQSTKRLVIPTYDAVNGRIYLFKTPHHPRFTQDASLPAREVALATAAAPVYFQAATSTIRLGSQYVDGGVWANNPSLVGVVEAIAFLGARADEINVLSIGNTREPFNIADRARSGAFGWNTGIISTMMNAQVEAHAAMAGLLSAGRLHRISTFVKPGEFFIDDARPDKLNHLRERGRSEAVKRENMEVVLSRFLNGVPAASYTPLGPGLQTYAG